MFWNIAGELYSNIYIIAIGIITIILTGKYARFQQERLYGEEVESIYPSLIVAVLITLFIGFRPVASCFMDMWGYFYGIEEHWYDEMDVSVNYLFDRLRRLASRQRWDPYSFIVFIAFIYFMGIWLACREFFRKDTLLALLVCLAAFSTFSYGTNGLKAGSAMSLFLVALAFDNRGKWWLTLLFLFLSLGFHHSMELPLVCFLISKLYKQPKLYFALWVLCFLAALFHITYFQFVFATLADEQGASYLLEESGQHWGKQGFRLDFILYSAVPIIIGWLIIVKSRIRDCKYEFLLNLYILLNSVWMLCMYASYTNRIAYLSWGLYPIVLIYPFLKFEWISKQYLWTKRAVILHWLFTFFMVFVYYVYINN